MVRTTAARPVAAAACTLFFVMFVSPSARAVDLFEDVTVAKGFTGGWWHDGTPQDLAGQRGGGAAVFDYDLDGDEDLFVTFADDEPNKLYRNDLAGGFVDVAAQAGVASMARSLGTLAADLDNDGDADLLELNESANILYRNEGDGTFTDVTMASGLLDGSDKVCYGAVVADYNLDGLLDVYLFNWHYSNLSASSNELWENDGGLHFTDVTSTAGVGDDRETLAGIWHDLDVDGDPDLISVNEFDPDVVYRNNGDGTFSDVTYDWLGPEANVDAGLGMGVHVADVDLDGLQDIYVTNYWKNNLYMNDGGGTWTDRAGELGCSGPSQQAWVGWGVEMFDCELDGDLDIYVVNGNMMFSTPNDLYVNDGTGNFTASVDGAGASNDFISRGAVAADFDLDGDQDLFVVNHYTPEEPGANCYYENVQNAGNNWLRVRTTGQISNRDGVGARVSVTSGGTTWIREVTIGSSFASSSSPILTFGLGTRTSVDEVRIEWPSGIVDVHTDVAINQTRNFVEGTLVAVGGSTTPARPRLVAAPNPARLSSTIRFELAASDDVRLRAFTGDGRLVRRIFSGRLDAGGHEIVWDGRNDLGTVVPPGVYFLELARPEAVTTTRVVRLD